MTAQAKCFGGRGVGAHFVRCVCASGFSFAMTVALSEAFRLLAFRAETAFALTLSTIICINFVVCSVWVFRGNGGAVRRQFGLFVLTSLGFRLLQSFGCCAGSCSPRHGLPPSCRDSINHAGPRLAIMSASNPSIAVFIAKRSRINVASVRSCC